MYYQNLPETVNSVKDIEEIVAKFNIPMRRECRFFINEDYREPKAFGIYWDGEDWVVYKNKANGQRAIRYRGKSEQYAAQELWAKFLDENNMRGPSGAKITTTDGNVTGIKNDGVLVERNVSQNNEGNSDLSINAPIQKSTEKASGSTSPKNNENSPERVVLLGCLIIIVFSVCMGLLSYNSHNSYGSNSSNSSNSSSSSSSSSSSNWDNDWNSSSWDNDWSSSSWDSSSTDWDSDW